MRRQSLQVLHLFPSHDLDSNLDESDQLASLDLSFLSYDVKDG